MLRRQDCLDVLQLICIQFTSEKIIKNPVRILTFNLTNSKVWDLSDVIWSDNLVVTVDVGVAVNDIGGKIKK